jgi:hypothetical protein
MTKDEAQREVVRHWRALPLATRQNHRHAAPFAQQLAESIGFETLGDRVRIIEGWIIRDMEQRDAVLREIDARKIQAPGKV